MADIEKSPRQRHRLQQVLYIQHRHEARTPIMLNQALCLSSADSIQLRGQRLENRIPHAQDAVLPLSGIGHQLALAKVKAMASFGPLYQILCRRVGIEGPFAAHWANSICSGVTDRVAAVGRRGGMGRIGG